MDVDDSAVQQMVEESVEHAFEDLAARRWIETKLKATELISATRKGLADGAGDIELDYKLRVESALSGVETALGTEDPQTKTGDLKQLQDACARLDEVSQPLADLLMDKAMTALLRKRGLIS